MLRTALLVVALAAVFAGTGLGVKLSKVPSTDKIQSYVSDMMKQVDHASRSDTSTVGQAEDYLKAEEQLMNKLNMGGFGGPLKGVMHQLTDLTESLPKDDTPGLPSANLPSSLKKEAAQAFLSSGSEHTKSVDDVMSIGSNSAAAKSHPANDAGAADAFVSVDATVKSKATTEGEPRVAAPAWPTLRKGDQSHQVNALQYLLRDKGACNDEPNGQFDGPTEECVKKFQSDFGIKADGVVGPKTWEPLTNGGLVKKGSNRADAIRAVQYLLIHRFKEPAQVNGKFGDDDVTILRHFQRMRYKPGSIPPKGVVGPVTWRMLLSSEDKVAPLSDVNTAPKVKKDFKIVERVETLSEMIHDVILMLKAMNAANQSGAMVANEICLVLQNKFDAPDANDHTVGCTDGREHCAKGFLAVLDAVKIQTMHRLDDQLSDCRLSYAGELVKDVSL